MEAFSRVLDWSSDLHLVLVGWSIGFMSVYV
jgi:hypothetical protein